MDFAIDINVLGVAALVIGALVIGVVLQLIGEAPFSFEWVATALAAFIGGIAASEWIVDWRTFEPTWEKLALVPALAGGLVAGMVVDMVVRYISHGSYTRGEPA